MFQEPRLLPWDSVGGNVAVGLGEGGGKAERAAKVAVAVGEVQLTEKGRNGPRGCPVGSGSAWRWRGHW